MQLVYLTSPSFSGSTLLTTLLGSHPQIATVGELKAHVGPPDMHPHTCSCGLAVVDCPFWREACTRARRFEQSILPERLGTHFGHPESRLFQLASHAKIRGPCFEWFRMVVLKMPGFKKPFNRILARNLALTRSIMEMKEAKLFLDSSKDVARLYYLLRSGQWDIKILRLVRDGRGTLNSFLKHHPEMSTSYIARKWCGYREQVRHLLMHFPDTPSITINYETLVDQVAQTLERLADFLGLEQSFQTPFDTSRQHIFGNPMRLQTLESIQLDESWRVQLTPKDLCTFERIAGDTNRRLGYS